MKRTGVRPHPLPGHYYQLTEIFVQWRWWGIALIPVSALLMLLPIIDVVWPQLLPSVVHEFFVQST